MAKKKDETQKPPSPGPAPSPEETRRRHVEASAKDRLKFLGNDLEELLKGDLKKTDRLQALETVGEKILEIALQTRGRLRSAGGNADAFLAATAANVITAFRHVAKTMEGYDKEMTCWADSLEIATPALDDLKRISKAIDRPGVKTAIGPSGEALFDDELQPAPKAAESAAPPLAPVQEPTPAPEPPAPAQATVPAREIMTLGMGPVIDVVPEPLAVDPFDGLDADAINDLVSKRLDELEEAGVEEGLKRKDWKKPYDAWCVILPFVNDLDDEDLPGLRDAFRLLMFALETRKPLSWAIPTEAEINDHAHKLDVAAGE
jgi:hypothetical protein